MVEDCKYVARIIFGECGEGLVRVVHFQKPISLFADVGISADCRDDTFSCHQGNTVESYKLVIDCLIQYSVVNTIYCEQRMEQISGVLLGGNSHSHPE
jgi:hypothetical protein